jgi:carbon storage regulator
MLVVSRQRDERIVLDFSGVSELDWSLLRAGATVEVTVVDIRGGDKVRVGVDAPPSVRVDRKELYLAKQRERALRHAAGLAACGTEDGGDGDEQE